MDKNKNVFNQAAEILRDKKRHKHWIALFLCLAMIVSLATESILTLPGVALTRQVRVLDCPYEHAGYTVAHTHNDDCYDSDGYLVCPLPEVEVHVHDDSCYAQETVLVCGQDEYEGHWHDETCYDEEGNLICGLEESEGHYHTDDCYETYINYDYPICGMEEVIIDIGLIAVVE